MPVRPRLCRTHPTYQAKRPPRGSCTACQAAYQAKQLQRSIARESARLVAARHPDAIRIEVRVDDFQIVMTPA
jgi:hypothetical protein